MNKLITLLFLLPWQALAQNSFEELFDINPGIVKSVADQVTVYHAENIDSSFNIQNQQLLAITQQLDQLIQQQPENPLLWFLQGLNYNNLASLHFSSDPTTSQQYIIKKLSAYDQAMKFDETQQPNLSAAIYATMKHALPMDQKITAIQKELALGGNGEDESYYWYLHWSNIHNLTQAGRLQEANHATQNMQMELEASGHLTNDYQQILKQVKAELTEAQQTQVKSHDNPATQAVAKNSTSQSTEQKLFGMNRFLWLVLIMLVVVLSIGLIYEKQRGKNKR